MIRRWAARVATALVVALVVHLVVIAATPLVVMSVARHRIQDQAGGANAWLHAERVTPQTQQIVRSSPDLAYSACAWDLSEGPVRISAPASNDYFSLSLYDGRSDNFFVVNGRDTGGNPIDLLLATRDQVADLNSQDGLLTVVSPDLNSRDGLLTVVSPDLTGIALLRYLAPTPAAFARADALRRSAVCDTQSP